MGARTPLEDALRGVPYLSTLDLRVDDAGPGRVALRIPRRHESTNHDGALHGAAVAAAAEVAASVAVGTEPTLSRLVPTLRGVRTTYVHPARTDVSCVAVVTAEQAAAIVRVLATDERATLEVAVRALDGHGTEVVSLVAQFVIRARR